MLSPLLQRLLFINQFNINEGKIDILGSRYIMLNAADLFVLQEIDETKMYAFMKGSTKKDLKELIEHAKVYNGLKNQAVKNIVSLSSKIGKTEEGMIKTLQDLFELYGLGKITITNLDNKSKKASIEIKDSTIAQEHLKKKKASRPVCTITAGILAGIVSYVFDKDVDCIEKKCLAKGDSSCIFVIYKSLISILVIV